MPHAVLHEWPSSVAEARAIQEQLRGRAVTRDYFGAIERVAGVDVGFEDGGRVARAAVAVLDFPGLALCAQAIVRRPVTFPYVPGYLSFREIPVVLDALAELGTAPDVILCDGQGIAHPRRFGIASHLGVLIDIPTIGVAKSRLWGRYEEPPRERGAWTPLLDGDEPIGAVLRTRANAKPLYVSSGHRVSLPTAIDLVMRCTTRFRLPETTRAAHRMASRTPP
ncbi:MAG TPA: deoxyribonuclease V [Burkholderiales bacterium]|nr:deoxyribonuclease V [Burkholderiales bacterium]